MLECMNKETGIDTLHFFPFISSNEASVHEAKMIQAIEPQMPKHICQLKNQRNGTLHFFNDPLNWSIDQQHKIGVYNLYSAWKVYEQRRAKPIQFKNFPQSKTVFVEGGENQKKKKSGK